MNTSKSLTKQEEYMAELVIDEEAVYICMYVMLTGLCQLINVFGICTNILNIICFVKQGFKDTININLLGLSISDLCSLITMACTCVLLTPALMESDVPFDSKEVGYLVSGTPHFMFTRASSCITAVIALEKCISVVSPLRVKTILTQKRTVVFTFGIFIMCTFSSTPVFVVNRLGTKFSRIKNKTIFGLITTDETVPVETITLLITNFLIPFTAFLIIATCTLILAIQLRKGQEFIKTAINVTLAFKMYKRNQKIAKMVLTISILFIACFVQTAVIMLAIAFQPDISVNGKYIALPLAICGFSFVMESINSSVNIFIYYHMSSKFRNAFSQLFVIKPRC